MRHALAALLLVAVTAPALAIDYDGPAPDGFTAGDR